MFLRICFGPKGLHGNGLGKVLSESLTKIFSALTGWSPYTPNNILAIFFLSYGSPRPSGALAGTVVGSW